MQIVCTCDVCGRQFDNLAEAKQHEADCYGLSQYEYAMWRNLVNAEASYKADTYIHGDRYTRSKYESRRDLLAQFELTHHLDGMPKPSDWKLRKES